MNSTSETTVPSAGSGFTPELVLVVDTLSYLCLALSFIASVLFYIFPTQRKYPASALGWSSAVNFLVCLYSVAVIQPLSLQKYTVETCHAQLAIENFLTFVLIGCNNVLAVILFVSVRMSKPMEYSENKYYLIGSVTGAIAPAVAIAIITAEVPFNPFACADIKPYVYIQVALGFFFLTFQLCLIVPTFARVSEIVGKARKTESNKHDHRLAVLVVRLMMVYLCQLFGFVPVYIIEIANPNLVAYAVVLKMIGGILDAIVLTVTNRALMKYILGKFISLDSSDSSGHKSSHAHEMGSTKSKTSHDSLSARISAASTV